MEWIPAMGGRRAEKVGGRAVPEIFETVAAMRARVAAWRAQGARIGVVPTMGFLHVGHRALITDCRTRCERVIVTIFVNPRQFGASEDLQSYPRDLDGDLAIIREDGGDAAFVPGLAEMYPDGFATTVAVAGITEGLCGAARPGHFDGVATVVTKLLLQCRADEAMFGEKDYQQLLMVRRLVRDLDIATEIRQVATVRESDGLAASSRNAKLSAAERARAPALHAALVEAAEAVAGGAPAAAAAAAGAARLAAAGFERVDYFELRDADTLAPVARLERPARVLAAAWLGKTRLIDNVPVEPA